MPLLDIQLSDQDNSEILRPHQGIIDNGKPPTLTATTNDDDVDVDELKHTQFFLFVQHRMNKKKQYIVCFQYTLQFSTMQK